MKKLYLSVSLFVLVITISLASVGQSAAKTTNARSTRSTHTRETSANTRLLGTTASSSPISPLTGGELLSVNQKVRLFDKTVRTVAIQRNALASGELYGTDGNNLYLIDKTDGSETLIGAHGPVEEAIGALDFDSGGVLYGMSLGNNAQLYTIDISTGAATPVGPLGVGFIFEGGLGFDAADQLFGVDEGDQTDAQTFTINSGTGAGTILGPNPGQGRDINGIAVDGTTFYAIDRVSNTLGTLNTVTGVYTPIGNPGAVIGDVSGLAVDPADGTLYATFHGGNFYSLDKVSGAATLIGSNSADYGLAFAPIVNEPPVLTVAQPNVVVDEGQTAVNSGTVTDPNGDVVALSATIGSVLNNNDGTWSWSWDTNDGPDDSQVVIISGDDGNGGMDQVTFNLTVNNVAPTANAGPDQTVFRNEVFTVSGTWTDPAGSLDDLYDWSWDLDGDTLPDSSGMAAFGSTINEMASFALEGFYTLTFAVTDEDGGNGTDTVVIEVLNQPPDCSNAGPSVDLLWPPNHNFVAVDVLGVTDPEGDDVVITIDSIFQDEAVDAQGSGNTSPDGQGVGTTTAEVRAERTGGGNGRVYHIGYIADDGHGGSCSSEVLVGVPHDQGPDGGPIDDGPLFDSTVP